MDKSYQLARLKEFDRTFVEAINYVEEHSNSVRAQRFEDAVYDCIESVTINPHNFQVRYKDIRSGIVRDFPYLILYRVKESQKLVQFTRVVSQYQDWLK